MYISPMLLGQRDKPFSDSRFIFEPKFDGHRLVFSRINGTVRLYTRHHNDVTARYPELHIDGPDVILDGELAVLNPDTGTPDFELTMERFQTTRPDRIKSAMKRLPATFVVFDILRDGNDDLRVLPLLERKERLAGAVIDTPTMSKTAFIDGKGTELYAAIVARQMEGIVAKRKNSVYSDGKRVDDWLKIVNYSYENVWITGFRKDEFGWLASVEGKDGRLRPAGVIELGVPPAHKKAFYGVVKPLITGEDREWTYVEPRVRARVKFRNWTRSGLLRSPVFVDFVL